MKQEMPIAANDTPPSGALNFVSIGECMVEMASTSGQGDYRLGYAGDTFNTAWYVKGLAPHWNARFVTRIGSDTVSAEMLGFMEASGIDTSHIVQSSERSVGLYLISLTDGERSFSYWRNTSAARQLADSASVLQNACADGDILYFSGITLAILDDAGRSVLLDVLRDMRASGKTIAFDSNLRPRLWEDMQVMRDTVMQAAAISDIVLPSYDDEAEHFGDSGPSATLERYANAGASTVVVKNGAGEVRFVHGQDTGIVVPSKVAHIVDTTSAGDSFNAGFLVGLNASEDAATAISLASSLAGHVVGQKGALVTLSPELTRGLSGYRTA